MLSRVHVRLVALCTVRPPCRDATRQPLPPARHMLICHSRLPQALARSARVRSAHAIDAERKARRRVDSVRRRLPETFATCCFAPQARRLSESSKQASRSRLHHLLIRAAGCLRVSPPSDLRRGLARSAHAIDTLKRGGVGWRPPSVLRTLVVHTSFRDKTERCSATEIAADSKIERTRVFCMS